MRRRKHPVHDVPVVVLPLGNAPVASLILNHRLSRNIRPLTPTTSRHWLGSKFPWAFLLFKTMKPCL